MTTQTLARALKVGEEFERMLEPGSHLFVGDRGWFDHGKLRYFCEVLRHYSCPMKDRHGRGCPRQVVQLRVLRKSI